MMGVGGAAIAITTTDLSRPSPSLLMYAVYSNFPTVIAPSPHASREPYPAIVYHPHDHLLPSAVHKSHSQPALVTEAHATAQTFGGHTSNVSYRLISTGASCQQLFALTTCTIL
ncbi:hypothetical protein CBOM_07676 [Ceraceosorus bombacis]|uniref:Uncharacterized protein n=1 Tax=Ceraceosorus bombacis TaxID=401625 RepID=A0A0N7LAR1_9BASI|nr:hypothetical protein CBOM_07676 [Ceraceosorus bombacis]